ncbi:MAG: hypothetical protein HC913_10265 [Microscillaceae bacterium]|nr:hypothetical protein [Microscillaceae bacterium]
MKRLFWIMCLLTGIFGGQALAQPGSWRAPHGREKGGNRTSKKTFISDRINLTEAQAPAFWEIYDQYSEQKIQLKRQMARIRRDGYSLAAQDADLLADIEQMFALRQKELDLEKELKDKLLKVINVRQLAELYRSEKDFLAELVRIFRERE